MMSEAGFQYKNMRASSKSPFARTCAKKIFTTHKGKKKQTRFLRHCINSLGPIRLVNWREKMVSQLIANQRAECYYCGPNGSMYKLDWTGLLDWTMD